MHLIIGGAYQGKRQFAAENFDLTAEQIFSCTQDSIDFSAPCIAGIEEYVYGCVLRGEQASRIFMEHREQWQTSVLICRDISGGLVPMDRIQRQWREETGRLCQYLTREADHVSRLFCGLEQRLK